MKSTILLLLCLFFGNLGNLAHANLVKVTCKGKTNYGDDLDFTLKLRGRCESNVGGKDNFCNASIRFNKPVYTFSRGTQSQLFVVTPSKRLVFANKVLMQFSDNGKTLDMMSWDTPLHSFTDFKARVNFGSSRTVGLSICNRTH